MELRDTPFEGEEKTPISQYSLYLGKKQQFPTLDVCAGIHAQGTMAAR